MSGHSKWSTIKHRKGAQDAKRGKIFTKLIKEITISTRLGGNDPNKNPRLRTAIYAAKSENMPKGNIERAIKKGSGEIEGVSYDENIYEGYGPGGSAIMIDSLTDNRNRTVADIRHIFNKYGGSLGENGCVSRIFVKKGIINIDKMSVDEDVLMEAVLNAGGEDVYNNDIFFTVVTSYDNFEGIKNVLSDSLVSFLSDSIILTPQNVNLLSTKEKEKMLNMLNALYDCDDVLKVYTNVRVTDKIV